MMLCFILETLGNDDGASALLVDGGTLPQGVDVVDVVLVINDKTSMDALLGSDTMLGKCLPLAAGPIPRSGAPACKSFTAPLSSPSTFYYTKSKGELLDMDLSELILREAADANERFYDLAQISAREILSGKVKTPTGVAGHLNNILKTLDERSGSMSGLPKSRKCPGDCRVRVPSYKAS